MSIEIIKTDRTVKSRKYQQAGKDWTALRHNRLLVLTTSETTSLEGVENLDKGIDVAVLVKKSIFSMIVDLSFQKTKDGATEPRYKEWLDYFKNK